jgi:hypothetical protein
MPRRNCCRQPGTRTAEWPEAIRLNGNVGTPFKIAGEVDVLSAEWGEVGEQCIRNDVPAKARSFQRATEINCLPQRDGSGDQGETTSAVLLSLGRAGPVLHRLGPMFLDTFKARTDEPPRI